MCLNRTSELKVMTTWISRELSLFNFKHLDILCAWCGTPSERLWPFEFHKSFRWLISSVLIYYVPESDLRVKSYDHLNFTRASVVQFQGSRYIMRLNRISEWKVMTIWISGELPLFNFERLDILCAWIWPPSEKFWPFWISRELPLYNFEHLYMWCACIGPPSLKLWPFEFHQSFRCSISSVSIYYAPESDLRVKSYDHLNLSRVYFIQFRASLYVMRLNRTSDWKVMAIWISWELPLLNYEGFDI